MDTVANMNLHYFRYPFSYYLDQQKKAGCTHAVLWGSTPHIWVDSYGYEDPEPLKKALDDAGIALVAYAAKPYAYSIYEPEGTRRHAATLAYYENCIKVTQILGLDLMVIEPEGALRDLDKTASWQNCGKTLRHLCHVAGEHQISIAVGTVSKSVSSLLNTMDELKRMKGEIGQPNFKALLNTAVAGEAGETPADWGNAFGPDLALIYFVDGRNGGGEYAWGEGCFPLGRYWEEIVEAGFQGPICLRMNKDRYEFRPTEADSKNFDAIRQVSRKGGIGCE